MKSVNNNGCEKIHVNAMDNYYGMEISSMIMDRMYGMSVLEASRHIIFRFSGFYDDTYTEPMFPGRVLHGYSLYYCFVDSDFPFGKVVVPVTSELASRWEFTEEELFRMAQVNTPRMFPGRFERLEAFVEPTLADSESDGRESNVYILTNEDERYGAAAIAYPGMTEMILDRIGGDFWILPSSIHELIIAPYIDGVEGEVYRDMVRSVNDTVVEDEDILGYEVRLFSSRRNKVLCAHTM